MRYFLSMLGGAVAAGMCAALIGLFSSKGGGPGFSSSELKILPWVVFFIVSFSIKSAGQSGRAAGGGRIPSEPNRGETVGK